SELSALTIATIYWGASLATGPAWNTWQGTIIPRRYRAKFFAKRSRLCQITTLVGFLAGGFALEAGKVTGHRIAVFATLFSLSFVCRILSSLCMVYQTEPSPIPPDMKFLTLREQWKKFIRGSTGRLLLFAVSMQVGVYVAGPFFVPFMLKELHFAYTDYAILIGSSFVSKFVCLPIWGRLAHRTGAHRLLWIGAIGVIPLSGGWVISVNYWWLLALQLLAGSVWGAYELALVLLFFETIPESERTSLLTIYNVGNSAALAAGSFLGAGILMAIGVSPTGYMTVFAASTILRFLTLIPLYRIPYSSVPSAAVPVRPVSIRTSGEILDDPVLPGLPDQSDD
ncbi:MAG: MFS transporter, partial [Planctomycetes bacterium]|nr:MFS transporter [Planctomycetota bacterium]